MTQRSLLLSALIAAALGGGAYAQGTGPTSDAGVSAGTSSDSSATSGNGPVPASPGPAQDSTVAPTTGSSSYGVVGSAYARDSSVPRSRADVQADGTAAMHAGEAASGEALTTRDRPHGGPINADAPSTGAAAGHTNGLTPYPREGG